LEGSILSDFVISFCEDIAAAISEAESKDTDPQYRLGIRRLAKAFFDKAELFEINSVIPEIPSIDIDVWYKRG
jgi:hypothetical protein